MNRAELETLIEKNYGAQPEFLWEEAPGYAIFRHEDNRKWFAVIMDVSYELLGLSGKGLLDIANLKADPLLINSLVGEPGFARAYHMNKTHWITVLLDGSADDETLISLLDMSYQVTAKRIRRKKTKG